MQTETPQKPELERAPADRPTVFFAGFTWDSEHSLAPLMTELESRGHRVLAASYYDTRPPDFEDLPYEPKDATDRLAMLMLAQMKQAGLEHTPVNVVAHSYGMLVYQRAFIMAKALGLESLAPPEGESREVIAVAPAGSLEHESHARIIGDYALNFLELGVATRADAAWRNQLWRAVSEPLRRGQEAHELATATVDYEYLTENGVHVHLLDNGSDRTFPHDDLQVSTANAPLESRSSLADRSAGHSDILLNPARNAQVIDAILQAA